MREETCLTRQSLAERRKRGSTLRHNFCLSRSLRYPNLAQRLSWNLYRLRHQFAAGKKVIRFVANMADAPQTARNVLREVQTLHTIFRQLQRLTSDRGERSISREERICLDDLVATLTGCVCVFSELDGALESLGVQDDNVGQNFTVWNRTKWAATEESIQKILVNLQMNKISLQSMLSIYSWFVIPISY